MNMKRLFSVIAFVFLTLGLCHGGEQNADSLRAKILQCFDESRFVEVVAYTEQALALYEQEGALYNVAGCYNTLGGAYMRLGQYDEAIRNYNTCTEIMDQIGGRMAEVNKRYVMNNIAAIYYDMEEYDLSEEMYWKCIEMLGDVGTDTTANLDLATYYQNLSGVRFVQLGLMAADDPQHDKTQAEAIGYAEQALALSQRYGDWQEKIINRRIALSKALHAAGRLDEADAQLDTALVVAQREKERYFETAIVMLNGQYAYDRGDNAQAEQHYLKAMQMAKESHYDQFYMDGLKGAYLATKASHPERSIDYLEESIIMRDSIYNEDQQALIRDYQVRYQMAEKEHELELQQEKTRQSRVLLLVSLIAVMLLLVLVVVLAHNAIQRKKRNEMLTRLNETKDQLFSVVTHDIKTPLLSQEKILDIATTYIDDMPRDDLKEYLSILKTSVNEMKSKIVNVINWVKDMVGDTESLPAPFNLSEMADKVVRSQAFEIGQKSLQVHNTIPKGWMGNDDVQIIEMVLQNILSNAVKYSFAHGAIEIEAQSDGDRYLLRVVDHGKGIGKERLDKMLKTMASPTEGTDGELGTGIGLFVSRQMMERIGGTLALESEKDLGTTVTISVRK